MSNADFPRLSGLWVRELLGSDLPDQPRSTCSTCALAAVAGQGAPATAWAFDPQVKCCGYQPHLPAFLVGMALDEEAPASPVLRARIAARVGVSPLGVGRGAAYDAVYESAVNVLGRSRALRCSYYLDDSGLCGVHPYRNALCATWFCKVERGAVGQSFWTALRGLLEHVELELSRRAGLALGAPLTALIAAPHQAGSGQKTPISADEVEGRVSDVAWAARWGAWVGREEAYFREAARWVRALTWAEIVQLGGAELEIHRRAVLDAWAALGRTDLPARLAVGRHQTIAMGAGATLAVTWSILDPVEIPVLLGSVLHYFDGSPVPEVLMRIREERGLELEADLLHRMVDQGILVAV